MNRVISEFAAIKEEVFKWKEQEELEASYSQVANYLSHAIGFFETVSLLNDNDVSSPEGHINRCVNTGYSVDFHFRKSSQIYDDIRHLSLSIEEDIDQSHSEMCEAYGACIKTQNVNWQKDFQKVHFDYQTLSVQKQFDFYSNHVLGFENKIVVLISDAFRYELAHELFERLDANAKNTVSIEGAIASIPSYTNLGMSNLLPNVGMTVEEGDSDLIFKINGLSTVSHNRQAILQSVVEDSQTIDYPSLKKMDKKAIRAFFKEARITYVYHDWMDAIDDKKVTEHEAFNVTEKALEDINWVIQKVVGEVRIMNMIVTSDHGFLYVPDKLEEKDRETLEKLNYLTATKAKEEKKDDEKATTDFVILEPSVVPKQVRIMDNQTGVSYRGLFGDYMKGATKIQLTDPYIRLPYQFRNLMEFCMMLDELKDEGDEMGLHLVTWNDEEHKPQSIESLKDVQETLSEIGINFTYDMQDLHDRSIMTDNGWKVLLGRGLDVFERANGRFNVAEFDQRKRKWKNCEITFIRI